MASNASIRCTPLTIFAFCCWALVGTIGCATHKATSRVVFDGSPQGRKPSSATNNSPLTTRPNLSLKEIERTEITAGHTVEMKSLVFADRRRINIYVPPSYDEQGKHESQSYPVIYLIDGGVDQDFLAVSGMVRNLSMWKHIPESIVVGIETRDRYHELSSSTRIKADLKRVPHPGGATKMRRFIVEEVMPLIDSKYRTNDRRVLMGESMAGLFVIETMLELGDRFSAYLAVSPSLWWNDQALVRNVSPRLFELHDAKFLLYFSLADEGGTMWQGVNRLAQSLHETNYPAKRWYYQPRSHESHATTYLPAAADGLRWIGRIWQDEPEKVAQVN